MDEGGGIVLKRKKVINILVFLLLTLISVITLFPIIWTAITSLKTDVQMFAIPPDLLPNPATLSHYKEVITGNFPAYIRNSILVTFFSCAISLVLGIPAAYGFAKYGTKKTNPIFAAVTAIRMVPTVAMVIPFFLIIRNIHLSDTLMGLIITYIPFELTLIIWMLKNFFEQIRREVEEAAELDGLSAWGILLKVVLPMSKSSVGVAGLMAFLFSWNEFMFALSLTSTKSAQTLTVGIAGYVTSFQTFWGSMSATGILFMIPAFILTFIFQKDLVKGLTAGAVKG